MVALQKLWKMFFISSKKLFSFSRYSNFCISTFPSFSPCQPLLEHVRLVWDIYYAHAYLCHYDSALFCFQKLELRQFIFLINCRSNLTINIVKWGKKMKNKWLTMPTLTKENFIFDSKLSPGWFSVAEGAEVDAHDWNQGNWKGNIFKSGREKLADFCGTCHGKSFFQLVVTLCWLQFF